MLNDFSKKNRIIATIFSISFIVWIGGSLVRSIIAFSIFDPSSTQGLIRQVSNDILMQSVYLFSATSSYTTPAFLISFIIALILLKPSKIYFKNEGWLMMSFILFFISAPIQLYLIYVDIQLSIAVFWKGIWEFYSPTILNLFYERIDNVLINSLSGISFLSNLTIIALFILQPLKKNK
jgi:hypothetical protein